MTPSSCQLCGRCVNTPCDPFQVPRYEYKGVPIIACPYVPKDAIEGFGRTFQYSRVFHPADWPEDFSVFMPHRPTRLERLLNGLRRIFRFLRLAPRDPA